MIAKGVADAEEVDAVGENAVLDENLISVLPAGSKVVNVAYSGMSAWVRTLKIDVELPDGSTESYFKKGAPGNRGREMMKGAFESESLVYSFIPDHVPKPVAWGTYKSKPNMHFYLCHFQDMTDDLPDPARFGAMLARLHRRSMGKSPAGRYGFHAPTHLAFIPNDNSWADTWTEWFSGAMLRMFTEEEKSQGHDEELDLLKTALLDKVIPRLLRPMETGGHAIQPCLCHSDVWPGNVKRDAADGKIVFFDSCGFWGHHESDLGCCKAPRYSLGRPYVEEYFKNIPVSEPAEDFEDRHALYAL
ncbi:uncharacterized protein JN550_000901 [Neoarthrinium moseri]|uniref:uncharacterized protein n=1 Tax=Neoarthrinium moseri TaxID=1658444 RepID=UPI001FDB733C|nr:uncharacterized protein JN550_000901 [Neoarthrinium moseri]KAI1876829.1 hypothetical protein JN550_000901 [Neoarthrinium moseri]